MNEDRKGVAVMFYTGEYSRAFDDAIHTNHNVWYRELDFEIFSDGFEASSSLHGDGPVDEQALRDAWKGYTTRWLKEYETHFVTDVAIASNIFILRASEMQLIRTAIAFKDILIDTLDGLGGDDSVFDYYPDAVEVLYQLCKVLPDPVVGKYIYELVINTAWSRVYGTEGNEWGTIDNCFPTWEGGRK